MLWARRCACDALLQQRCACGRTTRGSVAFDFHKRRSHLTLPFELMNAVGGARVESAVASDIAPRLPLRAMAALLWYLALILAAQVASAIEVPAINAALSHRQIRAPACAQCLRFARSFLDPENKAKLSGRSLHELSRLRQEVGARTPSKPALLAAPAAQRCTAQQPSTGTACVQA